jgi:DNA-binding GntR family transcriptional regulator
LNPNNRNVFELPISQAELANWLGTSRGHLNRALDRLEQLGLIRIERQLLTILDRPGLRRITEGLADE